MNGSIKTPIAVLKIGEQRVVQSNLEFPEGPVTFKLIAGSGMLCCLCYLISFFDSITRTEHFYRMYYFVP